MNQLDMTGRHAVITGGASGLGLAIAQRMISSGAQVTLWDRDPIALKAASEMLGPKAAGVQVDVARHDSVVAAVAQTHRPVHALVNSAGIAGPNTTLWNYSVADWDQVMQVNVNGTFLCCRELVPLMKEQGWGRVVNIASVAGKDGNPNASAYSTSKAAVIGMTKSLGKELAQTGVRVNCVTPAAVKTAIFDQITPAHVEFMLSKIPMGRFGQPDEIAAMVTWLCTDDCSFSTGAVFDLSGGRSTY
ncbi:MAG: SDR family oxidoreductase [Betaproteobacteria bacterium]|jgi:3-oxoacyl-[acyl-carrier protein] reductase|nr:SDR family oxidoreductase [Betaproteobacteria bacterium]